jgi:hypothetical protein
MANLAEVTEIAKAATAIVTAITAIYSVTKGFAQLLRRSVSYIKAYGRVGNSQKKASWGTLKPQWTFTT